MKMEAFHCLFFILFGVEMIMKFNQNIRNLIEFTCKTQNFPPVCLQRQNFAQKNIEAILVYFCCPSSIISFCMMTKIGVVIDKFW
jgi:hypothetical protein